MKYKVKQQEGRYCLYLYTKANGWYLHQCYLTEKTVLIVAAKIVR